MHKFDIKRQNYFYAYALYPTENKYVNVFLTAYTFLEAQKCTTFLGVAHPENVH